MHFHGRVVPLPMNLQELEENADKCGQRAAESSRQSQLRTSIIRQNSFKQRSRRAEIGGKGGLSDL